MAQKRKQYVKLADGTLEQQMLATSADIVEIQAITGITATDVQGALEELKDLADNGGVTSVNNKTGAVTIGKSDVGLGNVNNTSDADKPVSTAQQTAINTAKSGAISDAKSYTDTQLASYIKTSAKGVAGGVASLGTDGKVPSSQLPSYVDDVIEGTYSANATTPAGETGKIYVDTSTGKTFRWSGSKYVEISSSLALGETSSTAYAGNKGKANATAIANITNGTTAVGNASKLGGVEANKYAKLTDIPRDELFVITGSAVDHTVSETYNEIVAEFSNGKIPVLKYTYAGDELVYHFAYFDEEKVVFVYTTDYARVSIVNVNANGTVTERTMLPLITVDDSNGSGPIIESITKNVADVSVTRRAMQNSDLPNSGVTAGVYSAVQVNSKGVVTAGNQLIEWGTSGQTKPSASLAVGGLFFMKV